MKNQTLIKPNINLVKKGHIYYEQNANGKIMSYKSWLGDYFAFLYDMIMKKNIFPKKFSSDQNRHNHFLKQVLKSVKNKNILELGTGSGAAIHWLDPGNHYTGVDVSPGLLKIAVRRFKQTGFHTPQFYILDVEQLPFQSASFDVCICMLTLNFFKNTEAVIKEIHRLLKKNGTFYASVPVIERKKRNAKIEGILYAAAEMEQLFIRNHFRFESFPENNGTLFYFKAQK